MRIEAFEHIQIPIEAPIVVGIDEKPAVSLHRAEPARRREKSQLAPRVLSAAGVFDHHRQATDEILTIQPALRQIGPGQPFPQERVAVVEVGQHDTRLGGRQGRRARRGIDGPRFRNEHRLGPRKRHFPITEIPIRSQPEAAKNQQSHDDDDDEVAHTSL